MSHGG
jgi:hypothetical protein